MLKKTLIGLAFAAIFTFPGAGPAAATTYTLDGTNAYSVGLETGTITRTEGTAGVTGLGFFVLSGLTLDYADTAAVESLTMFGGSGSTDCIGCTRRSKDLLIDTTGLIFTVLSNNNIYTGLLSFFMFRDITDVNKIVPGSDPTINGGSTPFPSAAFELNLQPPSIPTPATLPLFSTGLVALGFLGWRRKRQALRD